MTQPKPCPFCGGGVKITDAIPRGYTVTIAHDRWCPIGHLAGLRLDTVAERDRFLQAWNTRVLTDPEYGAVHTDGSRSGGQPVGSGGKDKSDA